MFSSKYRPVWASVLTVAVLAVVLAVPPARALAGKFLRLFRAERVGTVYVDFERVNEQLSKLPSSSEIEKLLADTVKVEPQGEREEVSSANEAGMKAGIRVRTLTGSGEPAHWTVHPAAQVTLQLDLQRIRAILDEIGYSDLDLPPNLEGAVVNVALPPSVVALFGECGSPSPNCTVLTQLLSPSVTTPAGFDVEGVATAMLQVLGLTEEEAREFSQNVDWTTTLVVPVPRNVSSAETVVVDGVKGSLVLHPSHMGTRFLLIWIKDEVVYTLSGPGDKEGALSLAGSLS